MNILNAINSINIETSNGIPGNYVIGIILIVIGAIGALITLIVLAVEVDHSYYSELRKEFKIKFSIFLSAACILLVAGISLNIIHSNYEKNFEQTLITKMNERYNINVISAPSLHSKVKQSDRVLLTYVNKDIYYSELVQISETHKSTDTGKEYLIDFFALEIDENNKNESGEYVVVSGKKAIQFTPCDETICENGTRTFN